MTEILVKRTEVEYNQPLSGLDKGGSMRHLNIREIQEILPHRHPFLLLDYIEIMSRASMPSDINVYRTGKNFLPDIFRESLSCREC